MRKFLLFSLILSFAICAKAQTSLVVSPAESWQTTYTFVLSDVRELSFADGVMKVDKYSQTATDIPLSAIGEITFGTNSGISIAKPARDTAALVREGGSVRVTGLPGGEALAVYGTDGRLHVAIPSYDGESVDISALDRGVYVVVVGGNSFKFVK